MRANIKAWRESATIIALSRKNVNLNNKLGSEEYQVLFQKRSSKSKFLPDAIVFPGGACNTCDSSNDWIDHFKRFGITNEKFKSFHQPNISLPPIFHDEFIHRHISLRITAIRETFEELGILICKQRNIKDQTGTYWAPYITDFDILHWQAKVHNDPLQFLSLCQYLDCYPDIWSLNLWGNWLTPINKLTKRFDTVFFLVAFEEPPPVHIEKNEVSEYQWSSTNDILKAFNDKQLIFRPPQWYEITRLNHQHDLNKLMTFASARTSFGCELFFPVRQTLKDGVIALLPGDELYPTSPDYFAKMQLVSSDSTVDEINNMYEKKHRIIITTDEKAFKLECQNYVPKHFHLSPLDGKIPLLESHL